jgi:hypothetical protein
MTARTGLGNSELRNIRLGDIMGTVTIDTEGRPEVSFRQQSIVNAVEGFRVVVEMASFTALVIGQSEFAKSLECPLRMRIGFDVNVTIRTGKFVAVDGNFKSHRIDIKRALLTARQHNLKRLLPMAAETILNIRGKRLAPRSH